MLTIFSCRYDIIMKMETLSRDTQYLKVRMEDLFFT